MRLIFSRINGPIESLSSFLFRCGLSALSMAEDLFKKQKGYNTTTLPAQQEQELNSLLTLAQQKGFSRQGEMYSAENLAKLAKEFYALESLVISDGFEDDNFVVSEVLKGSAVLVPYDADKNHEPCLENGHRAHWALVTGQVSVGILGTLGRDDDDANENGP